ncbi:MAG: hypothetical protein MUC62_02305 [Candidatus Thermoplasmatota archaeon]|jgi:hypothetical protein|nr:hypothetical protein [Candidatus Thermoplasmatota archaeon]
MKWVAPLIVLLVVLVAFTTYQYILPRTDLEVRTVYHESPGGGGTGGVINVNILLTNKGNREVTGFDCSVNVMMTDGIEMTRGGFEDETLLSRDNTEIRLYFVGSHYSTYRIVVRVVFGSMGNTITQELVHSTIEDSMNLVFVDRIN